MIGLRLAVMLLAALALSGSVARATSSDGTREVPVPSLEPKKTAAEWRALTREQPRARTAQAACRPLRAVFYAASDWLRLATKLRASASPCAEYYVSVPPIVADKTTFRRDQAQRIRALGPNFHALAEVHFTTWNRWVASTGSSWHTAGVTARQRMAEAGYDVGLGDSWMLNELNSAVRRGDGSARIFGFCRPRATACALGGRGRGARRARETRRDRQQRRGLQAQADRGDDVGRL